MSRSPGAAGFLALVAALHACSATGGGPAAGPSPVPAMGPMLREDRVLVGDYSVIPAVGVSRRYVFGATRTALIIYDRLARRWLPPLTVEDGFPLEPVNGIVADPGNDAAWLALSGAILVYQPMLGSWQRIIVPGQVQQIVFDRLQPGEGAYVLASGAWYRVDFSGIARPVPASALPPPAQRVGSGSVAELLREYPGLQASLSLLAVPGSMRHDPVLSIARAPERSEVWAGTAGSGLFRIDPVFGTSESVPYGLDSPGAGAIARGVDGLWIAPWPGGTDGLLSFVSSDLQSSRWLRTNEARRGARAPNRIAVWGVAAWIAAADGLHRVGLGEPTRTTVFTSLDGLPDDDVLCVLPREGGTWAGTRRGLVFVREPAGDERRSAADVSSPVLRDVAVRALAASRDTIWAATDRGIWVRAGADVPFTPASATFHSPLLDQPALALAGADSLLAAVLATGDLVLLDTRHRSAVDRLALPFAPVGPLTVAIDSRTLVVAGRYGAMTLQRDSRFLRRIPSVRDARDALLAPDALWLATTGGLLRLRRLPDGSLP